MTPEQLKASILQQAMEGKLVKQDPNDNSALNSLKNARLELKEAMSSKKMRKEKYICAEVPKKFPKTWGAARLIEICKKENGSIRRGPFGSSITKSMFVDKGPNTFKVYEQGNAIRHTVNYGSYYMPDSEFNRLSAFEVHPGDIIISCAGTIGKTYILPNNLEKGIINQALMKLEIDETLMNKKFFLLAFQNITKQLQENAKGSAIKNIASLKYLKNEVMFPLPPLEEQERIVAKIEKLLPLVDEYAKSYNQLQNLNANIAQKLKQSILQDAMEGKLVKQNPDDEPASVLLDKIKAEKEQLIKEKKIKKTKTLPAITDEEIPFGIPDSWEWVKLFNILKPEIQKQPTQDFNYIDIGSVNNKINKVTSTTFLRVGIDKITPRARQVVNPSDILFSLVRPYLRNIAIAPKTENMIATTGFYILKPYQLVDRRFIFYLLLSDYAISTLMSNMKGIKAPSIKKKDLQELAVPLPPLEEQKRIVAKIEKLFKAIDESDLVKLSK